MNRVMEIMNERQCSYGTAYAQYRREKRAEVSGFKRGPGRPLTPDVAAIMKELDCTSADARFLLRARQMQKFYEDRKQEKAKQESADPIYLLQRKINETKARRVQAKLAKNYDAAVALSEEIDKLQSELDTMEAAAAAQGPAPGAQVHS